MLSETEYLLVCLAEEAGELAHECHKALRFGLNDHHPDAPAGTNAERIVTEYAHVVYLYNRLCSRQDIPEATEDEMTDIHIRKHARFTKYMQYARQVGQLAPEPTDEGA